MNNWCDECNFPLSRCRHGGFPTTTNFNTITNAEAFMDWIISLDDIEMMHVRRGISLTTIIDQARQVKCLGQDT